MIGMRAACMHNGGDDKGEVAVRMDGEIDVCGGSKSEGQLTWR
jgi:hypothetical protein